MPCTNIQCPFYLDGTAGDLPTGSNARCMIPDAGQPVSFRKGQVLFREGQPSLSLFSLANGMVKIYGNTENGREQIVGLSHAGDRLVGLQSISASHYAYSASAAMPLNACKINHNALKGYVQQRGDVAMKLVGALNAQLAYSRKLMTVLGHKSAAAKIASLILLMVPDSQHDNTEFSLPFSRREIASLLNVSEETVCRVMADMQRSKIIKAPRGLVAVLDWKGLRAMAHEALADKPALKLVVNTPG